MLVKRISNPIIRGIVEWLISIALGVLLFLVIRTFVFRLAHVEGSSMEPTLQHGNMVVLNRFSYLFSEPSIGDIVAFPYPQDPSEYYIKRIIAGPGDLVDLRHFSPPGQIVDLRHFRFYVNNEPLDDRFSTYPVLVSGDVVFPVLVPENMFFVLGDNRNGSVDSRWQSVGTIYASDMVGRVAIRIWPFNAFGSVDPR